MVREPRALDAQQVQLRIVQLESFLRVWQLVRMAKAQRVITASLGALVFADDGAADRAEAYTSFMLYSMLFSVFDRSGIDVREFQAADPELHHALADLGRRWHRIEKPVSKIRHTIGFHGAKTQAGTQQGLAALSELGTEGAVTAMELIEDLFHLAPWLSAHAQVAKWIPPQHYPLYREMVANRASVLEQSRTRYGNVDESARRAELGHARQALASARAAWAKLVEALSLKDTEEHVTFYKFWEDQLFSLSKRIDSAEGQLDLPAKLDKLQKDAARAAAQLIAAGQSVRPTDGS